MLSLGMIVRNEARTISDCLDSVAPFVDEVVIGFAGESTDNTRQLVEAWAINQPKVKLIDIEWHDDFAEARNIVLDACTGDYFLWLDGDDVLVNGQKMAEYIARFPDAPAFYMGYDYAQDEQGNNVCFLIRERIVKRSAGWRWHGAIHEVLSTEQDYGASAKVPDIWVKHRKPADKHDPMRNLQILYSQLEASEPTPDPRILAYLGSENAGRGNLTEAILHWNRFIKVSGWDEEKYQTQVKISNAYRALGNVEKALSAAFTATEMMPSWPDAYLSLARTYCMKENWAVAIEWLRIAASKPVPETMLITNPMEYTYDISVLIAVCYTQLRDWDMALQNYEQSFRLRQDPDIAQQIAMLRQEVDNHKVVEAYLKLREHLARNDEWMKVRKLLDCTPKLLEQVPVIQDVTQRTIRQTQHIGNQELMIEHYRTNPHWVPMDEDTFSGNDWLKYPRMAFALEVAQKVNANEIIDWGCSDGFISLPLARETGAHVRGFDADPRCTALAQQRADHWGVHATFTEGAVGHPLPDKADLAIFFEVIEHVDDPEETLDALERSAKHIALTTPYLAWEGGNIPNWDTDEMKGHVRIFDVEDMERLLRPRGRINNLYKQPWGRTGWIFADYAVGARATGPSIIIGAQMGIEPWGPQKLRNEGLGGSETAVIRLGEELAKLDRQVTVYCPVDEPGYYNEVRYRDASRFQAAVRSDMYIAWRMPEAADWDINTERLVLWMHDTDAGDRLTPDRASRFHRIVVLTEWHRNHFLSKYPFVDPNKLAVIGNGVDLERFSEPVVRNSRKVVYSSSPDRGLDIILEHIWPKIVERVPDAELHIYYGWTNFDSAAQLPGYDHLVQFKNKVQQLFLDTKNVVQHGRVSQAQLARELQEAKIWLYPTYFHETYCITAVEAQLAGAIPVTNHLAALGETVKSGIIIEGDVHDHNTQMKYVEAVIDILTKNPTVEHDLHRLVRENAPVISWSRVATKFIELE